MFLVKKIAYPLAEADLYSCAIVYSSHPGFGKLSFGVSMSVVKRISAFHDFYSSQSVDRLGAPQHKLV